MTQFPQQQWVPLGVKRFPESVSSTLAAIAIKSGTCKHSSVYQLGAQRVYELQKKISLSSSYEESYGDNSHSISFGCVSV